ncbi:MAG: ABC transporter substrate-binding protein [Flavobacteriales bacterium]|nr:ABC transporter substrate-binding protein [Flavobacteriales bacterium]
MHPSTTRLRIGGVPEHFNLPWILAMERNVFPAAGIDLSWTYYAGGTGAMTRAMAEGELDLAILLTEGFVSARHKGLDAVIVKNYIETPLCWGIFTGGPTASPEAFERPVYAISRMGSGSHLMAMIHAQKNGITPGGFKVVHSLEGAVHALVNREADLFFWERFMTKPFVISGQLNEIGTFAAPWSGFIVAATKKAVMDRSPEIRTTLALMNQQCEAFTRDAGTPSLLASRFPFTLQEAVQWLVQTRWSTDFELRADDLRAAQRALMTVGEMDGPHDDIAAMCSSLIRLT